MVRLSGVDISYGGPAVLRDLTLDLRSSHHVLMGGSGSGKSTLLKLIVATHLRHAVEADLPTWTGTIECPENVTVSYLPQEPSLAPWLTVSKNIELGRKLREGPSAKGIGPLGELLVERLHLTRWLDQSPGQISLGTARRVSLARCLVSKPDVLLLDEPFSGLDFDLRERALDVVLSEFRSERRQIVMVTHEPYEAAALADFVHILPGHTESALRTLKRMPAEECSQFSLRIRRSVLTALGESAHV